MMEELIDTGVKNLGAPAWGSDLNLPTLEHAAPPGPRPALCTSHTCRCTYDSIPVRTTGAGEVL